MVFNRKDSFFLDLGSEGAKPANVAIAEPKAPQAKPAQGQSVPVQIAVATPAQAASSQAALSAESPAAATVTVTTAEAIAAELRAAQEALPPPSNATFAPDCLNPTNALRSRRRLAGANLAGFKDMASGMFRN
jgi:hypothetical protein